MTIIVDGTGKGYQARVDDDNLLRTKSVSVPQVTQYAETGDTYILSSGYINITDTGTDNAIYYFKNTSTDRDYHLEFLRTCNDQPGHWRLIKNPTTGTIFNTPTSRTPVNSSFQSNNLISALSYTGADSETFTDGTEVATWIQPGPGHSIQEFQGGLDLGAGQAMGITYKPTSGTGDVCIMALVFTNEEGTL